MGWKEVKEAWELQTQYNQMRMKGWEEIERRKYYEGFNVGKEKEMFQEELKDLELVYQTTLVQLQKQVEDTLPSLLHYMEEFVNLHKKNEAVREKLDALLAKTGRKPSEEDYGGDDE